MSSIRHLGEHSLLWHDPDGRRWWLVFRFAEISGSAEVVGFEIRQWTGGDRTESSDPDGPHPLTSSLLRALPFADQASRARQFARDVRANPLGAALEELEANVREELARQSEIFGQKQARTKRTKWTSKTLAEAAQVYSTALARNEPPTQAVADHFGLAHSSASKVIRRARDAELLPETTQGKAAGRTARREEDTDQD